jgi:hypothetical protein
MLEKLGRIDSKAMENGLKAVSLIGAAASWLYTNRGTFLRGKIKTDFEIWKLSREILGTDQEFSRRIEAELGHMIPCLYRRDSEGKRKIRGGDLALACFCSIGAITFLIFGFYSATVLYKILHFLSAAFLSFIALGAFQNAFPKNGAPRRMPAKTTDPGSGG